MTTVGRSAFQAVAALLLVNALASAQEVTKGEFKCEQKTNKALAKFVHSKSKCFRKCLTAFWKGDGPATDCFPPYGGLTARCIDDTVLGKKGAENEFEATIEKSCDPLTKDKNDCPECYGGGDCVAFASDLVVHVEGQVDSVLPNVACELGADAGEQKCQLNTAKALDKLVAGVSECYDKCRSNARKGPIADGSCVPPATDPTTTACIAKAEGKAAESIDERCGDAGAVPDCTGTDDYPGGATWVTVVAVAIDDNQPSIYCESATVP